MTDINSSIRHAKISEIARLARVGTATVDRVLNDRPNVRSETRQRVLQAKHAIETGADSQPKTRPWRLKIFLPEEGGQSTSFLAGCFQNIETKGHATVECVFSKKLEPAVLARKLRACAGQGIDAVGFQALDDPRVRGAVEYLANLNIPCVPILSGLVSPALTGFIGIDNMSAGKTAGYLMGRLIRQPGPIGIISGGQLYRVHADREMGFRSAIRSEFADLRPVETYQGNDDNQQNFAAVQQLVAEHPGLVGLYNVGAGQEGVVEALKDLGLDQEIVFIAHNLTPRSSGYLLDGSMDIVIHQNMRLVAELAVQALLARLENRSDALQAVPVEIITRENILGATFG